MFEFQNLLLLYAWAILIQRGRIVFQNNVEFVSFLIKAKRSTYAGGGESAIASRLRSKDLSFAEGDYFYLDTYLGEVNFIGEEAVWYRNTPVWGMNYYGRSLKSEVPEGFSTFLKEALRSIPREAPFRGPSYFSGRDSFAYFCKWQGDIGSFNGSEEIRQNGVKIYKLSFHGGLLSE